MNAMKYKPVHCGSLFFPGKCIPTFFHGIRTSSRIFWAVFCTLRHLPCTFPSITPLLDYLSKRAILGLPSQYRFLKDGLAVELLREI